MKRKNTVTLLSVLLVALLLAGCSVPGGSSLPPTRSDPAVSPPAVSEPQVGPSDTATVQPAKPQPQAPAGPAGRITPEQAKAIALKHAGFTADQVSRLQVEPELADHPAHYDVEFHQGQWEYDYAIHAESGAILSFEKDD